MYNQRYGNNTGTVLGESGLGESINHAPGRGTLKRAVYLEGASIGANENRNITRVAPAPHAIPFMPIQQFEHGVIFESLKPILYFMRGMGILPVGPVDGKIFRITPVLLIYSIVVCLWIVGYIGYIKWDKVEIIRSAEGKFEEAVIDYLFTVYLFPVILVPITWYEARKISAVLTDWGRFEDVYKKLTDKVLPLFVGNKPLMVTIGLPVISCGTMVVTHITMVHFRILKVIPYCYINSITYLVGGFWYLHCDIIGRVATLISNDFERALRHIGPSQMVAEYRAMWMLLSKITRNVGMSSCFVLTFLCLYLFLVITLTVYGLLSQIQEGLGVKDVGLTITAGLAVALLYFICDEAHYASNCVKVLFQKKLLLVELSWMNDDAQQEIQMFLRATEMNETDMSLGGFFDVNRGLFKSLLATMVTYLVVLLQFQISLPEQSDDAMEITTIASIFLSTV